VHTESSITIAAPREKIYATVSDIVRWPAILPHYRWVRKLSGDDTHFVVRMAAHRDGIPISWESDVTLLTERCGIVFVHRKAFTKGMLVEWKLEADGGSTRVTILHDLRFRIPPLAPIADRIIGDFFISDIAGKTLAAFKRHLESGRI